MKNKKQKSPFIYKQLLIFSGICVVSTMIFLAALGEVLKISKTDAYNILGILSFDVPLVTHLFLWGKFFEWKEIKLGSIVFKFFSIVVAIIPVILLIVWLISGDVNTKSIFLLHKYIYKR